MSRRVLIDSNVFIEYFKGNPKASAILDSLLSDDYESFINAIVYSEVVFIFVSSKTGLSAKSLKKKPDLVKGSGIGKVAKFLEGFKVAEINDVVLQNSVKNNRRARSPAERCRNTRDRKGLRNGNRNDGLGLSKTGTEGKRAPHNSSLSLNRDMSTPFSRPKRYIRIFLSRFP